MKSFSWGSISVSQKGARPLLHFDWHQILNCFHLSLPPIRSLINFWQFSKLKLSLFHDWAACWIEFGLFIYNHARTVEAEWIRNFIVSNILRLLCTWLAWLWVCANCCNRLMFLQTGWDFYLSLSDWSLNGGRAGWICVSDLIEELFLKRGASCSCAPDWQLPWLEPNQLVSPIPVA